MRTILKLPILVSSFIFVMLGCGVKGKPLPPLTAPPIGRGQPTMAQPEEDKIPSSHPPGRSRKKSTGESR